MTSAFEKQIVFPNEASESIRKAWTDKEYKERVIKNDIKRRKEQDKYHISDNLQIEAIKKAYNL